jgi:hypothetical protein
MILTNHPAAPNTLVLCYYARTRDRHLRLHQPKTIRTDEVDCLWSVQQRCHRDVLVVQGYRVRN